MSVTRYEIELITPRYDQEVYDEFYLTQGNMVQFSIDMVNWTDENMPMLKECYEKKSEFLQHEGIEVESFENFTRMSFIYHKFNLTEDTMISREIEEMMKP